MKYNAMLTDKYELTMAQGYFDNGKKDEIAIFDAFFRKEPLDSGYAIMGGVDNIIEYIKNLKFSDEDIEYLRGQNFLSDEFLEYLRNFKFTGDIYAIEDGTPIFRNTPLVTVKASVIEAQIIESALLSILNTSILYTTASKKITEVTKDIGVMEFGLRRSLNPTESSKCSYIGGCVGTSNMEAGMKYGIPTMGTMAHSFVQEADSEYDAFLNFAKTYPDNTVLLIDTYDTLRSGIKNAIKVAYDYLIPNGYRLKGVRIDSGDLAYLSKMVRKQLDDANLSDATICLSNGLNAETLESLINEGAIFDSIGLGDNIVLPDKARVGCVYKTVAIIKDGEIVPKIKVAEAIKTTNPGYKKPYRIYDNKTGYAIADLIALYDDKIPTDELLLVDPFDETKKLLVHDYNIRSLQKEIFHEGSLIYEDKTLKEKRDYCNEEMKTLYPEIKRNKNPHKYYVDLTPRLLDLRKKLVNEAKEEMVLKLK